MAASIQARFAEALLDPSKDVPSGLVAWPEAELGARFEIYRNNVAKGLSQALAIRFPATEKIVGSAFFAVMAHQFMRQHPPASPALLEYGAEFELFVRDFPPAAVLPYLADVVRLENARVEAYHAADAAPVTPHSLAMLDRSRLHALNFALHPSFRLVRSAYPVYSIWAMNSGELPLAPIRDWSGEDVLIVRPHLTVLTRRLPVGGATFLAALSNNRPLGAAAAMAEENAMDFDLTANLAALFTSGVVIAVSRN